MRHAYGFDRPIYVQYLKTMKQIFTGQIQSYTQHVTVFSQIKRGLPATLSLAIGGGDHLDGRRHHARALSGPCGRARPPTSPSRR